MRTALFWISGIVLVVFLRGTAYLEPDPSDAYRYAYVGAQWTHGWVPYRDLFENKPPAIYALNALAYRVSAEHHWRVLYVIETALAVMTVACFVGILRRWLGTPFHHLLALVAIPLAFGLKLAYSGNMTEGYQVAFVMAGLWVVVATAGRNGVGWLVLAGAFIGLGSLFKPPGLAAGVAVIGWTLVEALAGRIRPSRAVLRVLALAAGVVLPWLIATAWFARHGLADDMLYASLSYNRAYGQEIWRNLGLGWVIVQTYEQLWHVLVVLAAAAVVTVGLLRPSVLLARGQTQPTWRLLAVLWMLGDLGGALAGGRCYNHYFIPLMFSATAVAGFALVDATRQLAGLDAARPLRRTAVGVLLVWVALLAGRDVVHAVSLLRSGGRAPETAGRFELVAAARELARPGDTLFTWGSAAFFFYEMDLDPIHWDMDAHRAFDFDAKAAQIGKDLLAAFRINPPDFIVTDVNEDFPQRDQPDLLAAHRAFEQMIEQEYRRVIRRGPRTLFIREDHPSTQAEAGRRAGGEMRPASRRPSAGP